MQLEKITNFLEDFFSIKTFPKDPQMSLFVPMVYENVNFNYEEVFEQDFNSRFDGLMLKGGDEVNNIYLATFPTPDVLESFFSIAQPGDIFFSHHPIYIENGDPEGEIGRGWMALTAEQINTFKKNNLSYFSCHSPMDYHLRIGTRAAMIDALNCIYLADFFNDGTGPHGLIGIIPTCTTELMSEKLMTVFNVPYLDLVGTSKSKTISKVALIAGGADNVDYMMKAEALGVDAYICGEFNSRFNTPWGIENQKKVNEFLENSSMAFFGVSHAACENLTFKTQLRVFFASNFPGVNIHLLEQKKWWF